MHSQNICRAMETSPMIQMSRNTPNQPGGTPEERVARHLKKDASLLAVLHAIQDEAGYIPPDVIGPLAQAMSLSRAQRHGAITLYPHFPSEPRPRLTPHFSPPQPRPCTPTPTPP